MLSLGNIPWVKMMKLYSFKTTPIKTQKRQCLHFRYCMNGRDIGRLEVYLIPEMQFKNGSNLSLDRVFVIHYKGNLGIEWKSALIDLEDIDILTNIVGYVIF